MPKTNGKTPTKPKVEITPEQRKANLQKKMQEDFTFVKDSVLSITNVDKRKSIIDRIKFKFPAEFIAKKVEAKDIRQADADWLKEVGRIGATRSPGTAKAKRPWRYQCSAEVDSPTGKALIALDAAVVKLYTEQKDNIATICKWHKHNSDSEKQFNTYFAKVKPTTESNGKK
jgi:hypothetical protein